MEFSSLSNLDIFTYKARLGCEINWQSFNLSIEFDAENMPFNENNKYTFSSVESVAGTGTSVCESDGVLVVLKNGN